MKQLITAEQGAALLRCAEMPKLPEIGLALVCERSTAEAVKCNHRPVAGDFSWWTAVPTLVGAAIGGLAAVTAQIVAQSRQSRLAKANWERERLDSMHQQRMNTYIGLLGQLREVDHYHRSLIDWEQAGKVGHAPQRPALDGLITDRVNAFASKEIQATLQRALQADKLFRNLLTAGQTPDGEPAGSPRQSGSQANRVYLQFRAAHRDIVDFVRAAINFPDLVDRDRRVLIFLARGMDDNLIAKELNLGLFDVRHRVHRVLSRLSEPDRKKAIDRANEVGIGA